MSFASGPSPADADAPTGRRIAFTFDGRSRQGVEGQSVARALLDSGDRVLSRSIKYHRPRSIFCGRGRCVSCHVEVDGKPGVRACLTPLREGMDIRRQDFRPVFAPLLTTTINLLPFPAGFYFRFFTGPTLIRRMFLGTLRMMAGVGRIRTGAPGVAQVRRPLPSGRFDIVVIGMGMAGMAAAVAARRHNPGARILIMDEYHHAGGHMLGTLSSTDTSRRREQLRRDLDASGIDTAHGVSAQGWYPGGEILLAGHGGVSRIRAGAVIFATGANDVIPLFENNDLPGVFGMRATRLFLERDGIVPGKRAIVYGTAAEVPDAVALLQSRSVSVEAVLFVDAGTGVRAGVVMRNTQVVRVKGTEWVQEVQCDGTGGAHTIRGDMLCVAMRGQPAPELPYQAGFRYELEPVGLAGAGDDRILMPVEDRRVSDRTRCYLVGEAAGKFHWQDAMDHAARVGAEAGA